MKAKVYLEPEYLKSYVGTHEDTIIRLAPAFRPNEWYFEYKNKMGEDVFMINCYNINHLCDVLRKNDIDLRPFVWSESPSRRHGYNPFLSRDKPELWYKINPNVYFLKRESDGLVKIGFSATYDGRRKELQCQYKDNFTLLGLINGDRYDEREVHGILANSRVEREWFNDSDELRELVKEYCYLPPDDN